MEDCEWRRITEFHPQFSILHPRRLSPLAPPWSYLCRNWAGFLHFHGHRNFARLRPTGEEKNVTARLRRIKRRQYTSVRRHLGGELNLNQAQPPNRIPLPHLDSDRLVRVHDSARQQNERENTATQLNHTELLAGLVFAGELIVVGRPLRLPSGCLVTNKGSLKKSIVPAK